MSFLKGFADAYVEQYNSKRDQKNDVEKMKLKYQMEELVKRKTLRDQQKQKEDEWKSSSEYIAKEMGDPSFATIAYEQLRSGRTIENILEDTRNGYWKKDPNYKQPEREIRMPQAVINPIGESSQVETELTPNDTTIPMSESNRKQIQALDPTLLEESVSNQKDTYQPKDMGGWTFNRTTDQKVPDLADIELNLANAKQTNDPIKVQEWEAKKRAYTAAETLKEQIKARAEGKNIGMYVQKTEQGNIFFPGERTIDPETGDEYIKNTKTGTIVRGEMIPVDEDTIKRYWDLAGTFDKQSADYKVATANFHGAINTVASIEDILQRNPAVTTGASGILSTVRELQDEIKGVVTALNNQQTRVDQAFKSGDPSQINQAITSYQNELNKLQQYSQSILSGSNEQLALDKTLYEALRISAAYQFAASKGVGGRNMSDKDFQLFYEATGGKGGPQGVIDKLYEQGSNIFSVLEGTRNGINSSTQIKVFEQTAGFKPDVYADRMENIIRQGDDYQRVLPVFGRIYDRWKNGTSAAVNSINQSEKSVPLKFDEIPAGAVKALKQRPELRDQFDKKYGPGAAKSILGE